MLKGKKSLYILIPAVAAVWGLIIYRVIASQPPEDGYLNNVSEEIFVKNVSPNDSCKMIWSYRDPFLDRPADQIFEPEFDFSAQNDNISNIKIGSYKSPEPEKKVQWPSIFYQGLIRNKSNGKMVAVFTINKRQVLLSEKQVCDGVLVESADNNKAVVKFDGEIKTIEK
ncbi:MAG TPA: hypothetical protein DEP77_05095 [Bacteroidales bacterium]|nr:hypothetical protein [Bacteroidales bacterium]